MKNYSITKTPYTVFLVGHFNLTSSEHKAEYPQLYFNHYKNGQPMPTHTPGFNRVECKYNPIQGHSAEGKIPSHIGRTLGLDQGLIRV